MANNKRTPNSFHTYIHTSIHTYIHIYIYIYIWCIYIYIYIHTHTPRPYGVYIYIYTHTHTPRPIRISSAHSRQKNRKGRSGWVLLGTADRLVPKWPRIKWPQSSSYDRKTDPPIPDLPSRKLGDQFTRSPSLAPLAEQPWVARFFFLAIETWDVIASKIGSSKLHSIFTSPIEAPITGCAHRHRQRPQHPSDRTHQMSDIPRPSDSFGSIRRDSDPTA